VIDSCDVSGQLEEGNDRLMVEGAMIYVTNLATCSATEFELAVSR
jgi:hypothetical protein